MRIISRRLLVNHWNRKNRGDSEQPLKAWYHIVHKADWTTPSDVKAQFRSASFVGQRVVFNIAGNKYRLIVWINYDFKTVYLRFVGTHKEYDKINVEIV